LSLDEIREEREKWFSWKNIVPLREIIDSIEPQSCNWKSEDGLIKIDSEWTDIEKLKTFMPWRKGPFQIGDVLINSEWKSDIKYELLEQHIEIEGKKVADVGCNNGYYMFRMAEKNPEKIVGFDPSPLFKSQFQLINRFIGTEIEYEMLGVEHFPLYEHKFDTVLCLGVLYHRSDPVATLKQLKAGLNRDGTLILDTFIIDGDDHSCLFPEDRYAKMRNIYFIPTLPTLKNWCSRAGFKNIEVIATSYTTSEEQRKTEWIEGESLSSFLSSDGRETVEGYPPPQRAYLKLTL
jgi:tRNA (mo5U34)-methyltransferase